MKITEFISGKFKVKLRKVEGNGIDFDYSVLLHNTENNKRKTIDFWNEREYAIREYIRTCKLFT